MLESDVVDLVLGPFRFGVLAFIGENCLWLGFVEGDGKESKGISLSWIGV